MNPRIVLVKSFLLASSLFAQTTPAPQPDASPATVTATFWNVQWFPGRRPKASRGEENRQIRAVHDDLAQLNSDIVAFEEVRDYEHATLR
ncbi:MAG TPA: hypothetical protein VLO30_02260 [Chthoniobacterales bacterium]|nr:hypothetical protein [Chthoniobacterales bacterium]